MKVPNAAWTYGLPAVVAVLQVVGSIGHGGPERRALDWLGTILLLLGPALLIWRRRRPVPVLVGVFAVTLCYVLLNYTLGPFILSFVVMVFTVVRAGHRLIAWSATILLIGTHVVIADALGLPDAPGVPRGLMVTGWMLVVLIGGEVSRSHLLWREEQRRAREAEDAGKIVEERLRIAREIHDVVAHNMSMISVQAGVALHLMDADPELARSALTTIKQASREALIEMRSVIGVLRQADDGQPAPGLARVGELVERARQAGLQVDIRDQVDRSIPAAVDAHAFRIIQEATTNVLRHAIGARRLEIEVTVEDDRDASDGHADGHSGGPDAGPEHGSEAGARLVIVVRDDGIGAASGQLSGSDGGSGGGPGAGSDGGSGGGSGLLGMRERAAAFGGSVTAGPRQGGGYGVRAELELKATQPAEGST